MHCLSKYHAMKLQNEEVGIRNFIRMIVPIDSVTLKNMIVGFILTESNLCTEKEMLNVNRSKEQ